MESGDGDNRRGLALSLRSEILADVLTALRIAETCFRQFN